MCTIGASVLSHGADVYKHGVLLFTFGEVMFLTVVIELYVCTYRIKDNHTWPLGLKLMCEKLTSF